MIPNAHCLTYRVGKDLDEKNGIWKYGLEMPQASLREEFQKAGFSDIEEYTIGELHVLDFLAKEHYLYVALEKLYQEYKGMDDWGQGYLLVTIGMNYGG